MTPDRQPATWQYILSSFSPLAAFCKAQAAFAKHQIYFFSVPGVSGRKQKANHFACLPVFSAAFADFFFGALLRTAGFFAASVFSFFTLPRGARLAGVEKISVDMGGILMEMDCSKPCMGSF